MERIITIQISPEDFTDKYKGKYFDYFQIHIYSVPEIISNYYNTEIYNDDFIKTIAENHLKKIKERRSPKANKIKMFEKNENFLMCEDPELFDDGKILSFDKRRSLYEYDFDRNIDNIDAYLGDVKVDDFIKSGLVTIGASDLYEVI